PDRGAIVISRNELIPEFHPAVTPAAWRACRALPPLSFPVPFRFLRKRTSHRQFGGAAADRRSAPSRAARACHPGRRTPSPSRGRGEAARRPVGPTTARVGAWRGERRGRGEWPGSGPRIGRGAAGG